MPLHKLPLAQEIGEAIFSNVFLHCDCVSDRRVQFTLHVLKAFYQQLSINESLFLRDHLQTNGQVDCLNQEIVVAGCF